MECKTLGSVEVVDDAGRLALGGPQQRKILAVLLCEPEKALTFDRLIDVLWSAGMYPTTRAYGDLVRFPPCRPWRWLDHDDGCGVHP